ncbi:unnamed protein product [marine sediment metagenome]|uniref:Uncharacterized protein n=1 Tax=marine sediment metagenome TaxID=412755 RepID=X1CZK1_9ZZZZ
MAVPWHEGKRLVSNEEYDLRWAYMQSEIRMSLEEFNEKIKEIRERTGKP